MIGVMNDVPVPKLVPPVVAAYQLMVPVLAVANSVTVPVPHLFAGVVAVMVGDSFTVAVTAVLVDVVQPLLVAST